MPTNKSWKLGIIASIASIAGIPLAFILWYFSGTSTTPQREPSLNFASKGDASPILNAGRDASLSTSPGSNVKDTLEPLAGSNGDIRDPNPTSPQNKGITIQSKGDNSPVVNAGRDAIVNVVPPKPDFITDHDGAGALLMTEPDFRAFIAASIETKGEKIIGRLVNGTSLSLIEQKEADLNEPTPPWAKVRVLDGAYEGKAGWLLLDAIRKPR